MTDLFNFTAELLEYNGALVERTDDELEAILPPAVAEVLEIKEHAKFLFSAQEEKNGVLVSYDSEVFRNISKLLTKGKFSVVTVPPPSVRIEKLAARIHEKVILNNAVFSVDKNEEKPVSYLLVFMKYTATSDEKNEGILSSLINEFTLAAAGFAEPNALDIFTLAGESKVNGIERQSDENVMKALLCSQQGLLREELQEFIDSMERRLNRDVHRVYNYYHTLIQETKQLIERKRYSGEDKNRNLAKIGAIETELKWKIQDLISKYSLTVDVEPVSFIRIETVAPVFWLTIKRRKETRRFPLTYNPLIRAFDTLPCESCFNPRKTFFICDEHLHILCSDCFKKCPHCGRNYCRVCHKTGCPKCR